MKMSAYRTRMTFVCYPEMVQSILDEAEREPVEEMRPLDWVGRRRFESCEMIA